jgi:hypothetical protein
MHNINKNFWEELIAYFPYYDTGHIENEESKIFSILACVIVNAVTFLTTRYLATAGAFLPSRCQATMKGIFIEQWLSNDKRDTHTHTHTQTATWSHIHTLFFQNK